MANDFVNTITTKDGTTYNVQDKRLEVTAADAGKIVSVNEQGELTLVSAPASGTKLYKHQPYADDMSIIYILNSSSTQILTSYDLLTNYKNFISFYVDNDGIISSVLEIFYNSESGECKGFYLSNGSIESFVLQNEFDGDVVTPL